ncbi:DUF1194 domain-containing protein [Methylobacterium radiodurans]|uniref:tRNA delta(2)-isopentenylpyrophosphate transferase n=1 Tax=Methylobacterium radiodurans TaxID=2202828 RepID=A0A2U8VPE2_9HYPH|nr:DUF1194 domain-containing protein [Methylobacterium radiodurans]AWN35246.1 tRNA delta(2)-isopentenylpyrophosphate transferase [Methylobacterium radiodurans]
MRPSRPARLPRGLAQVTIALLAFGAGNGVAAERSAAVALVVSVDVSQSVDDARFNLQMEGIAEALEDPGVVAAMTGNPGGTLFAMVTWADRAGLALAWRRIATRADARAVAAEVRATPRQSGEFTCVGQMFRTVVASVIPTLPMPADRIVVDVSGDGIDNCTDADSLASDRAALLATGATINGLPILVPGENDVVGAGAYRAPGYGLQATPLPQERIDLVQWYRANVVGGPGAFSLTAAGYADFSMALKRKFIMEVSDMGCRR